MPRRLDRIAADARRLPDWLRKSLSPGREAASTDALLKDLGLHTICESGRCPNRDECYSQRTATFMILGDICTRSCSFCSVSTGRPGAVELDEPARVAQAARTLGLKHVVVTSVNRDDLADEGAGHFVEVIRALRGVSPDILIEILTPDFKRDQRRAVSRIMTEAPPDVFNHNVETAPSLYKRVRPQADYAKSLAIFGEIRSFGGSTLTKSGLMLGLGETKEEVLAALRDLRGAGVDILTLGQYLQSSTLGLKVDRYLHPDEFAEYKAEAMAMGFPWVESGPYVRSSFHAKESLESLKSFIKTKEIRA